MKVHLIDHTGHGDPWRAAELLIWAKRTRVEMAPGGLAEIRSWPVEKKMTELGYIAATIPSSWEFVDFTFLVQDVTRAFTHQVVRTRVGSYAQQNQSVQKLTSWDYRTGPSVEAKAKAKAIYDDAMAKIDDAYRELLAMGVDAQDARGLLPTNVLTSIVVKWNLRTCCETFRKRASRERGHGEYQEAIDLMRQRMVEALPWTSMFLDRDADLVADELRQLIDNLNDADARMAMSKRVDQLLTNV